MADIAVTAVEIGLPYFVGGVKVQYGYLFRFGAFRDKLLKEYEKLKGVEENVVSRVEADRNNGRIICPNVEKWLVDVSAMLVEADKLIHDMKNKKGCFMGRTCWYPLSKKFEKKTVKIIELREEEKSYKEVSLPRAHLPIPYVSSNGFVLSNSSQAVLDEIIEGLKDERTKVIGLYGMGGVGKTTLAEQVIESVNDSKLFDKVAMVVVSETQDLMAIQDTVAAALGLKFEDENDVRTKAGPLSLRLGKEEKILIILDDIWDEIDLPKIGMTFTADQKGCKLLITTRFHRVCSQMNCNKEIHIDVMCETEAWDLFKKKAALHDESPMIDTAKEVAIECGGLPIAIVPLARALVNNTPNQWKDALQCLRNSNLPGINNIEDKNAYKCMKLSYGKLNGEEVKFCFLMCSLFPEDHEIEAEFLVRYAWGLGICRYADTIEEARIKMQSSIDHLKDYCLLINTDTNIVRMHDVVRHFALWIAFNVEKDFTVGYISRKSVISKSLETYMAISLIIKDTEDLPSGLSCGNLKLLLLCGEGGTHVSGTFFKQLEALQVLTIDDCYLESYFHIPISLRVLSLEGCKVGDISSLGKLKKLEIVSFLGSDIQELADEVGELKELKVLNLSNCKDLERIPAGLIQKLSLLEELYVTGSSRNPWEVRGVDSSSSGKARLSELNSLSKLSVLCVDRIGESLLPDCFSLTNLTRYKFFEPPYLRKMDRDNAISKILHMNKFNEISLNAFKIFFPTVEQLVMKENEEIGCIVPEMELGVFNTLISLDLEGWRKMVYLIDTTVENVPIMAFRNLKKLILLEMHSLKELCLGQVPNEFLHKLERVSIKKCPKLCSIFQVQEESLTLLFSTLEELTLMDLPELSCVWEGHTRHIKLNRLTTVRVEGCSKLKSFFQVQDYEEEIGNETDNSMLFSALEWLVLRDLPELSCVWEGPTQHINLNGLTTVRIEGCSKLKSLFQVHDYEEEIRKEDDLVLFSSLVDLKLTDLPELSCVWERPTRYMSLNRLTEVKIQSCSKLKSFFQVQDYEEEIGNEADNSMLFSALEKLQLIDLPELSCVWEGPTRHISLNSLTKVKIQSCSKLKSFFQVQDYEEEIGNEADNSMLFSALEKLQLIELPELSCVWEGPTQHINLFRLRRVRIYYCPKLKSIFSLSMALTLVHLEEIVIEDCDELEHIIEEEEENGYEASTIISNLIFTRLVNVSIRRCNKLKYVFPIFVAPSCLQQVKTISLEENVALEKIFKYGERDQMEIELCHLRELSIEGSPNLVNFSGGDCSALSFPSLVHMYINDCAIGFRPFLKAKQLIWLDLSEVPKECWKYILCQLNIGAFSNLECLAIESLIGVEEVIRLEVDNQRSDFVLPIQRLELDDLPQLAHICNCPSYTSLFQNLTTLKISSCYKISYIFSPTLAQNLPMLEFLTVRDCKELVQVISNDNEGVPNNLKLQGFPSLKEIKIAYCDKIKYVFPLPVVVGGLPNLKELEIEECDGVEYVFGKETLEAGKNSIEKEEVLVVLPKLKALKFKDLPSLRGFSGAGYNFIFPLVTSETDLEVTGCPNITESFTRSPRYGTRIPKENASLDEGSEKEIVLVIQSDGETVDDEISYI